MDKKKKRWLLLGCVLLIALYAGRYFTGRSDEYTEENTEENREELLLFLQEKGLSEEFLQRRTVAQMEDMYELYQRDTYTFESSRRQTLESGRKAIETETVVFIKEDEEEKAVSDILLLIFYNKEGATYLLEKGEEIKAIWDPQDFARGGEFAVKCYRNDKMYYESERPTEAEQGQLGFYITLQGMGDFSGTAAIEMVPKVFPAVFEENLSD